MSASALGRFDVLIDPEEISGVVLPLDGGQAREIRAERCVDDFFGFNVERREDMCAHGKRAKSFTAVRLRSRGFPLTD